MSYFLNNGINIYYEITGKGEPILLINGLASDTRQWGPLVDLLKGSFEVICYDMRSAGQSDKTREAFTISELTDEAYCLIKHLGLAKVHVLGFSMGGFVSMQLALRYPGMVDKMFLVATAPSLQKPHSISDGVRTLLSRTEVSPELLTEVFETIFGPKYKEKVSAQEFIKSRMEDTNPQPADAYLRQLSACMAYDLNDEVRKITTQTHIIAGDHDKLIPPENSKWLNKKIADSKLFILPGIGHMVPIEAPNETAEILTRICQGATSMLYI